MSRSFAIRWKDELESTWHLLHSNGYMHFVTYNQDLVTPTLLTGWTKLREFYGLTRNHQVTMTHYGQSVFLLTIFKNSSEPKAFPKWHSLFLTRSLLKSYSLSTKWFTIVWWVIKHSSLYVKFWYHIVI